MNEDELLEGVTGALTLSGWRWTHIRRSDRVTMGDAGLPDIIAVHPSRGIVLAWELKGAGGRPTGDQVAWIAGLHTAHTLDARILYPADYDEALRLIVGADVIVSPTVLGRLT